VREVKGGRLEAKNLEKSFRLVVVSSHYYLSPELTGELPDDIGDDFIWINWQRIASIIYRILENSPTITPETQLFANDFYNLLVRKNLRQFEGINVLRGYHDLTHWSSSLFFDKTLSLFRGHFIGFQNALTLGSAIDPNPKQVFFSSEKDFFHITNITDKKINPIPSSIFFGGSQ
jgi:hypothetical protein